MINLDTTPLMMITVEELAEYCHISAKSVYRHIQDGALQVAYVGPFQRIRVPIASARAYANAKPLNGNGNK